jgi:hypothetical protein
MIDKITEYPRPWRVETLGPGKYEWVDMDGNPAPENLMSPQEAETIRQLVLSDPQFTTS